MTDRPIIFSPAMVRALLEGRKTQTRRVLKNHVDGMHLDRAGSTGWQWTGEGGLPQIPIRLPYAIGDRLWVRKAWNAFGFSQDGDEAWPWGSVPTPDEIAEIEDLGHRMSPPQIVHKESDRAQKWFAGQSWRPSIHMSRWASRLTLTVTDVRIQGVQETSGDDALAEGIFEAEDDGGDILYSGTWWDYPVPPEHLHHWPEDAFRALWDSINAKRPGCSWDANPWVVAVTFDVHRCNIDQMEATNG